MKKKFISVAMFLALTASAPVWVSCSDYDDDIANLQSQVDELKGGKITADQARAAIDEAVAALKSDLDAAIGDKANNADVQTLMDKVAELSDALNGNSDDQTVVGLVAQVQSLIERVNKIEDTSLSQMQKDLENGLDGLRKEYEEADKLLDEAIAQKATSEEVEKLSAELKEIQGNLQKALDDLNLLRSHRYMNYTPLDVQTSISATSPARIRPFLLYIFLSLPTFHTSMNYIILIMWLENTVYSYGECISVYLYVFIRDDFVIFFAMIYIFLTIHDPRTDFLLFF